MAGTNRHEHDVTASLTVNATAVGSHWTPDGGERAWGLPRFVTDDGRVESIGALLPPAAVIADVPRSAVAERVVDATRRRIHGILTDTDEDFIAVIGPCSIHDQRGTMRYAEWLRNLQASLSPRLVLIMRTYVAKPRTHIGWKGLVNDPRLDGSGRVNEGLRLARQIMRDVNDIGVPVATEFVDPITAQYIADLVSWGSIGARTVESQVHRELASGLSCPVGFKNSTSGDIIAAINGVATARRPHQFIGVTKAGQPAIIRTTGNSDCHVVLRGGATANFDESSIRTTVTHLRERGVCEKLMIDCSHGNCAGDYRAQVNVASDVCRQLRSGEWRIKGLMVESNLVEGRQQAGENQPLVFGQSITDACLGLADTERVLRMLDDVLGTRPLAARQAVSTP